MSFHYETVRREFIRIQTDIPVRYKFLSKVVAVDDESIFQGSTTSVSGHGLLLVGKIPTVSWIPALLMQEIVVGLNVLLPAADAPLKALATVAWIEAFAKGSEKVAMGLKFTEISKEHQDELLRFVIKTQISH
jgi:c-di-GMP-binding flagellar brake protein YcgR